MVHGGGRDQICDLANRETHKHKEGRGIVVVHSYKNSLNVFLMYSVCNYNLSYEDMLLQLCFTTVYCHSLSVYQPPLIDAHMSCSC